MFPSSRSFPESLLKTAKKVYDADPFRQQAIAALEQSGHADDCVEHLTVPTEQLPESFYDVPVQLAGFFRHLQSDVETCIAAARQTNDCPLALVRKITALERIQTIAIQRLIDFLGCETNIRTYGVISGWICELVNLYCAIAINKDPIIAGLHRLTPLCKMVRLCGTFELFDITGVPHERRTELANDFFDTAEQLYDETHRGIITASSQQTAQTFITDTFGHALHNGSGGKYRGEPIAKMICDLLIDYGQIILRTDPVLCALSDLNFFSTLLSSRQLPDRFLAKLPNARVMGAHEEYLATTFAISTSA
jgi:hypothetical protein